MITTFASMAPNTPTSKSARNVTGLATPKPTPKPTPMHLDPADTNTETPRRIPIPGPKPSDQDRGLPTSLGSILDELETAMSDSEIDSWVRQFVSACNQVYNPGPRVAKLLEDLRAINQARWQAIRTLRLRAVSATSAKRAHSEAFVKDPRGFGGQGKLDHQNLYLSRQAFFQSDINKTFLAVAHCWVYELSVVVNKPGRGSECDSRHRGRGRARGNGILPLSTLVYTRRGYDASWKDFFDAISASQKLVADLD